MDFKITITICFFSFLYAKCVIPNLSVRKFDSKIIERKRQDTLEICRIFNEENQRSLNTNNKNNIKIKKLNSRRRTKRDVGNNEIGNPVLKQEDIIRVEKIIDKLYDDVDQGPVIYRRRDLTDVTNAKSTSEKQNRRFNFAPAQLFGPLPEKEETEKPLQSFSVKIPWIKKWKHGIVPFYIDSNTYDSFLAETILKAFDYIEKVTCIRLQRLRERPTDKRSMQSVEWLYITNPSGIRQCVHSNERKPNNGVQMVVFGYDCLSQGEIAHEIMHVLGFSHEHTRPDRDRYINILWDNIKSGYKKYFEVRKDDPFSILPYDYASVLHYPPRAFSKNGQVTVMTESGIKIGQREALSELDVEKIGMIYGLECVERNKDYLLKTCPSVVKVNTDTEKVEEKDVKKYFENRIWPYAIINFKIKDALEFTAEERENIKAVLNHIEKETCIEFRVTTGEDRYDITEEYKSDQSPQDHPMESKIEDDVETVEENSEKENITLSNEDTTPDPNYLNMTMKVANTGNDINEDENDKSKILRFGKIKRSSKDQQVNKINKGAVKEDSKKVRIHLPLSPSRRHVANLMVLKRSSEPGCKCPTSGRPNGNQILTINSDCFNSVNDLLHVFVHVLGLDHQHNMHDRDSYLHILWENLSPEIKKEMEKKLPPVASAGFAYDYQSVMHYPWLQIKDGVTNIMYPIWNDGWAMGHWQGLSWTDVKKLNLIYKDECEKRKNQI